MAVSVIQQASVALGCALAKGPNRFEELVQALKAALGPSSGLDSDDVDVEYLASLMKNYNSSESDWMKFAFADASRGYTRNLVDDGNGKSNLVSSIRSPRR